MSELSKAEELYYDEDLYFAESDLTEEDEKRMEADLYETYLEQKKEAKKQKREYNKYFSVQRIKLEED